MFENIKKRSESDKIVLAAGVAMLAGVAATETVHGVQYEAEQTQINQNEQDRLLVLEDRANEALKTILKNDGIAVGSLTINQVKRIRETPGYEDAGPDKDHGYIARLVGSANGKAIDLQVVFQNADPISLLQDVRLALDSADIIE